MTTFGTIHFTVKPNDTYKVNTDGDGFTLIDGKGDLGIAVRFESPIDLWHFAKKIEAQAMKAMTPTTGNIDLADMVATIGGLK